MLKKSYVFRLVIMCAIGMLPVLGYSGNVFASNVGVIEGEVTGLRSNASIGNVDVQVTDLNGKIVKSVRSQKDGTFAIGQLPLGSYKVKAGKAPAKRIQVTMAPPVTRVDFQVPEKGYTVFAGGGVGMGTILLGLGLAATIGVGIYAANEAKDNGDDLDDLEDRLLASP